MQPVRKQHSGAASVQWLSFSQFRPLRNLGQNFTPLTDCKVSLELSSSLFFPHEPRSSLDSRPTQHAQLGSTYPCVIKQVEEGGEQASPVGAVGTQHSVQEAIEGLELALIWLAETPDGLQWVVLVQHLLQPVRVLDALQGLHLVDTTWGKV